VARMVRNSLRQSIAAAKFQQQSRIVVGAPLIGDASALQERVARLLEPLPSGEREKPKRWSALAVLAPLEQCPSASLTILAIKPLPDWQV
jgi:hypothetical protein